MRAKDFLSQIEMLDTLIENKRADVQRWKDIANNTGVNMSGERVQSSGNHDMVANAICTYIDIEREEIDTLLARRKDIIRVIEQLPHAEYDLLYKVYVGYKDKGGIFRRLTLKEVTYLKEKSYSWATTTHDKALNNVQKIIDKLKP